MNTSGYAPSDILTWAVLESYLQAIRNLSPQIPGFLGWANRRGFDASHPQTNGLSISRWDTVACGQSRACAFVRNAVTDIEPPFVHRKVSPDPRTQVRGRSGAQLKEMDVAIPLTDGQSGTVGRECQ